MFAALPLALLSLEGIAGSPFNASDASTSTVVVQASEAQVAAAIGKTPRFDAELPTFLKVGFNRPVAAFGEGTKIGDQRTIVFAGGNHDDHPLRLFGITGKPTVDHHPEMKLTVVESSPGRVVFDLRSDMTMVARWAEVKRSVVTWHAIDKQRTKITWRLEYRRLLYPTIYFAPLQRFGMDNAADYLLDAVIKDQLR